MKGSVLQKKIIHYVKSIQKNKIILESPLIFKSTSPSLNGLPDLQLIYKGRTAYIEIKGFGDRLRPSQMILHKELRERLVPVNVIISFEDGKKFIDEFIEETNKFYNTYARLPEISS